MSAARGALRPEREPRIPLAVADAPTQRFYAATVFIACEAWKLARIVAVEYRSAPTSFFEPTTLFRALLLDFALVYGIYWLAIPTSDPGVATAAEPSARSPRRALSGKAYACFFLALALFDTLLLGLGELRPIFMVLGALANATSPLATWLGIPLPSPPLGLGEHRIRAHDQVHADALMSGMHTVHILPYGTAWLAPEASCTCVGTQRDAVIPVVFNQTIPHTLRYSITDAEHGNQSFYHVRAPKTTPIAHGQQRGADDAPDVPNAAQARTLRERKRRREAAKAAQTQHKRSPELVHYLTLHQPGIVQLESVLDKQGNAAQLRDGEVLLVPCPAADFMRTSTAFCPGEEGALHVQLSGVPPLQLEYAHVQDGRRKMHTLSHLAPVQKEAQRAVSSSSVELPLALDLSRTGTQSFALHTVVDACGNAATLDREQNVTVHPRAHVRFDPQQCAPSRPLKLLRGGSGLDLRVLLDAPTPWNVRVAYSPDTDAALHPKLTPSDAWTRNVTLARVTSIHSTQPGTYTLADLHNAYCAGTVGAPWTCEVIDVPPPTASIHFESIEDPCAGTVGVKALSVLEGEPPFRLVYQVQRRGQPPKRHERIVRAQTRDELEFWPSTKGSVTYTFVSLGDANYPDIPLHGPSFTQLIHPLASASFAANEGAQADATVHSCGSARAEAEVVMTGTGPWELAYSVRGATAAPFEHTAHIAHAHQVLDIALPDEVVRQHGHATISLLRLRDGKGCERRLATRDLRIDVRHTRATAGFSADDAPQVVMREGSPASLPLRLTGNAPWRLAYTFTAENGASTEHTATLHEPNASLLVHAPGTFTLQSVADAHCRGDLLPQHTYTVPMRPRPQAGFAGTSGTLHANGSMVRAPVCAGVPDSATLELLGYAPVSVSYVQHLPNVGIQPQRFSTSQAASPVALATETPGWHTYEITDVGDALYPSAGISAGAAQRLEQMVLAKAHAAFAPHPLRKLPTFCVGDTLHSVPPVQLHGTAPFTLRMTLRRKGTSGHAAQRPFTFTRTLHDAEYVPTLDAHAFTFDASGDWELVLDHVVDVHGCGAARSELGASLLLRVVETAGIVPSAERTEFCVGEKIAYVLQGMAPWTVHYSFNGKDVRVTSHTAEFSRLAEAPGVLRVHSVAHQQNQCRSVGEGAQAVVHALPSVRVSAGRNLVEALHAGREAEIVFTLGGEPPFSFTYQRTEPVDTHAHPRVLETHTVEKMEERVYRIKTTQEGTWSVVWTQDRWCQVSLGDASGPATWQ
ncbi:hypothetical protein MVES1_003721 [Malassezia vespertilionis]|uniref:Pom152p n=1 Tax=Malassezia vespertilionis TaxID=2020962 RepID=A0A2N1J8D6_9BASI|nr:uncharacterized protein MVES1_003721 [Malassezia vespertilionis]PKI82820.1 Pom152p [Malassezia vespertilionis]WFD08349.1 hypothetical protein MVES1_003721 [Malassezia vespertilionis]